MKYGFVYIWRDRKHKRYYVGCHWGTENDGYICSSSWMKQAYKHRPNDFKRRILKTNIPTRDEMFLVEQKYLNMIKETEIGKRYYNLQTHWKHWSRDENSLQNTKTNMSTRSKNNFKNPDFRMKYEMGIKKRNNRSSEPEIREKRRKTMVKTMALKYPIEKRPDYNRVKAGSLEHTKKLSEASKKMWNERNSDHIKEIGIKISNSLRGRTFKKKNKNTTEHNNKIRDKAIERYQINGHHSKNTKWWNNGIKNKRFPILPGNEWTEGRLKLNKYKRKTND